MLKKISRNPFFIYGILFLFPVLLFLYCLPNYFGNDVDWFAQHIVLADLIRTTLLKSGTLFPDFVPELYSGINFYALSYYGYLRPDVLAACLFPGIDIVYFVAGYSVLLMSLGDCFCYMFLKKNKVNQSIAFFISLVWCCSTIYFQSHRQIMFVNYLPFLFLALYAVHELMEKNKMLLLITACFLIVIHSYYFVPASFAVIIGYFLYKKGSRKNFFKLCLSLLISCLLSAPLTVPTFLFLIENKKSVSAVSLSSLFEIDWSLNGLLYNRYGLGLSVISWICLTLGLFQKKTRGLSGCLILAFLLPLISYILSGFLYARDKALLPLYPLVLLVCALILDEIRSQTIQFNYWVLLLWLIPFIKHSSIEFYNDCFIALIGLTLLYYKHKAAIILLMSPLMIWHMQNPPVTFLKSLPENTDIKNYFDTHPNTSIGILDNNQLVNDTFDLQAYRSSGYSSLYPVKYNNFLFDELHLNIPINNRVAVEDSSNIFYLYLQHIKTLYSKGLPLPYGFEPVQENTAVSNLALPMFYTTSSYVSEKEYEKLSFPASLEILINTIAVNESFSSYTFQNLVKKENPPVDLPVTVSEKKSKNLSLPAKNFDVNKIYVLEMDIVNHKSNKPVIIKINGQANKLSNKKSTYYNGNTHFTYVLSGEMIKDHLDVILSSGNYDLENVQWSSYPVSALKEHLKNIDPVKIHSYKNSFKAQIHMEKDGYFVTPFGMQKGFSFKIDGQEVPAVTINKGYAGCFLSKGDHNLELKFCAPGKNFSVILFSLGCILIVCIVWKERLKIYHHDKSTEQF